MGAKAKMATLAIYRCSVCRRIFYRHSNKAWIRSLCAREGEWGRLMRQVGT